MECVFLKIIPIFSNNHLGEFFLMTRNGRKVYGYNSIIYFKKLNVKYIFILNINFTKIKNLFS